MAVVASQVICLTTPTLLAKADSDGCRILIHKQQNKIIYLGGSNVTSANGFLFDHDSTVDIYLSPHDEIYGTSASGTEVAFILTIGNR
jgi:hypothetical protein